MHWKHVNTPRLILLITLLFTAFGAGVFRTPPILFMAATLCGAPFVGLIASRISSRGLKISRQVPESGMVGDEIRLRLTLKNEGFLPSFLICALGFLELDVPRKFKLPFISKRSGALSSSKASPLVVGVVEAVGEPNVMVPLLMPHTHVTEELRLRLLKRGVYVLSGAAAGSLDPIGLYSHFPVRDKPAELVIMPRPLRLQRLELFGGGQGAQKSLGLASVAEAADLHGVRPHRPGEGLRRIHWKATARTGTLHVVEWEEETASDVVILLDTQAQLIEGDSEENTLEMSIVAAATVASYCLENSQRVQIFWLESEGEKYRLVSSHARHRGALSDVLTALAKIKPCENERATIGVLAQEARKSSLDFDSALLLGSENSDFSAAWTHWGDVEKGKALAFSTESSLDVAGQSEFKKELAAKTKKSKGFSKEIPSSSTATSRLFKPSKAVITQGLESVDSVPRQSFSVRTVRVGRRDSIAVALERVL